MALMNTRTCLSSLPLRWAPLFALVALAACGSKDEAATRQAAAQASPPAAHEAPPPAPASGGQAVQAGVAYTPPAGWQDLGPSNMRVAQYRLAPIGGDAAPGEVHVFYFGAESGGGVEANLARWIGQMVLPGGGDPAAAAKRSTFTADGMAGHVVTLDGTYKSGGGPMSGGETKMLEGYRLVGVVLEGPQGSLFFKLTGPAATAKAMEAQLMTMMQGARKAG